MRAKALLAGMLLASILTIPGTTVQLNSLFGPERVATAPSEVLRPVRACLATIDQFIADGDLDSLWQGLDQFGHALDPWPSVRVPQRDLAALAFRATYPQIQLTLEAIAPSDELFTAHIGLSDGLVALPAWLSSQNVSAPTSVDTLLALDGGGAVVGPTPAFATGALAFSPPSSGSPFALSGPSQLVAAQLTLKPDAHGERAIAISGPAMIAPIEGTLTVVGDGRVFAPRVSLTQWRQLSMGETTTVAPGDLLTLSSGTAVLTISSSDTTRVLYATVLPVHPPDDSETEGGRVTHRTLAGTILAANAPAPVWFGSIDWVQQITGKLTPGNASLSAAWIVLPPGERAAIAPGGGISLAIDLPWLATLAARPSDTLKLSNSTSESQITFVIRAEPA
jgi:hypothetical protein